jgi:hypothetical protein
MKSSGHLTGRKAGNVFLQFLEIDLIEMVFGQKFIGVE